MAKAPALPAPIPPQLLDEGQMQHLESHLVMVCTCARVREGMWFSEAKANGVTAFRTQKMLAGVT